MSRAAPGGLVQRDEAGEIPFLFNKGGPQLSDIATVVPDDSERREFTYFGNCGHPVHWSDDL